MRKPLVILFAVLAVILVFPGAARAEDPPHWLPSSATPLPLHWVLDTGVGDPLLDVNNPWHIGRCPLGATSASQCTLPPAAVLDYDGDYNTRLGGGLHGSRGVNEALHSRGVKTVCYTDEGVQEASTSNASAVYDREPAYRFPVDRQDKASGWGGWWIDFTSPGSGTTAPDPRVLTTVERRIVDWCGGGLAIGDPARFDAIEFDETDYEQNNPTSPDVNYASQIVYNRALYTLAHQYGFAAIQKGGIHQTRDLVNYADATLNEECGQYRECVTAWDETTGTDVVGVGAYSDVGKAVWIAEYRATGYDRACTTYKAAVRHWNVAQYRLGLPASGGRKPCPAVW